MQQNSKTQNVKKKKPKNLNYDKTKKKKIVTKLKNSICDKTKKTQIVTKLQNFDCDKTQKRQF